MDAVVSISAAELNQLRNALADYKAQYEALDSDARLAGQFLRVMTEDFGLMDLFTSDKKMSKMAIMQRVGSVATEFMFGGGAELVQEKMTPDIMDAFKRLAQYGK